MYHSVLTPKFLLFQASFPNIRGISGRTNTCSEMLKHHLTLISPFLTTVNTFLHYFPSSIDGWMRITQTFSFILITWYLRILRALSICSVTTAIYSRETHVKRGCQNLLEFLFDWGQALSCRIDPSVLEADHQHFHLNTFLLCQWPL